MQPPPSRKCCLRPAVPCLEKPRSLLTAVDVMRVAPPMPGIWASPVERRGYDAGAQLCLSLEAGSFLKKYVRPRRLTTFWHDENLVVLIL